MRPKALGGGAVVVLVAALLVVLVACESSGARRSPKEILDYKVGLVEEHADELTQEQQGYILFHPGRTYGEIDQALETARTDLARRDEAEARARNEGIEIGERRRTSSRAWMRDENGRYVLQHTPFDPLNPTDPDGEQ